MRQKIANAKKDCAFTFMTAQYGRTVLTAKTTSSNSRNPRAFAPSHIMENSTKMAPQTSLFQVYLRLRPPIQPALPRPTTESWLIVEPPSSPTQNTQESSSLFSTHVTLQPPNDSRKRAIERFGFTKIFQEEARQLDIFDETGAADTIKSVLQTGRDGLIATLGVTGSGKVYKS